jgi:hypothetical protein
MVMVLIDTKYPLPDFPISYILYGVLGWNNGWVAEPGLMLSPARRYSQVQILSQPPITFATANFLTTSWFAPQEHLKADQMVQLSRALNPACEVLIYK